MVSTEVMKKGGEVEFNPAKRGRFVEIIIFIVSENSDWCGKDCPYRYQHPVSPRCSNPLIKDGLLEWEKGLAGLKRCKGCFDLFG